MIELVKVSKSYGEKTVIKNLSIKIGKGERIAIMGPSGEGKTTLIRIICGLEKQDCGEVRVGGRVSAVFQEDRLFEGFSVYQNVYCVCKDGKTTEDALGGVLLLEEGEKLPRELSGGMARRVAIARGLAACHDILILDEPFKGLDEQTKGQVCSFISAMEKDKTVVMVTHDRQEAEMLGASVFLLEDDELKKTDF